MSGILAGQEIESASLSHTGRVRSENQDAFVELRDAAGARLLLVADGMGGHRGGSTASRLAVEAVSERFQRGEHEGTARLEQVLHAANERVYQAASDDPDLHGMGTTAVALLLEPEHGAAWVGHVGDSRLYRLRAGQLQQITEDHSAVAELVRRGAITLEEAATHPRRNEILRSLGVGPGVEPEIASLELQPGDQVLLCSDGLSGVLADAEIGAVLSRSPPAEAVRVLVERVNALGAPDNVTVMIAAIPTGIRSESSSAPRDSDPGATSTRRVSPVAMAAAALALLLALLFLLPRLLSERPTAEPPERAAPADGGGVEELEPVR